MVVSKTQKRTRENLLELIETFAGSGQPKTKEEGDMLHAVEGLVGEHLEVGEQRSGNGRATSVLEEIEREG